MILIALQLNLAPEQVIYFFEMFFVKQNYQQSSKISCSSLLQKSHNVNVTATINRTHHTQKQNFFYANSTFAPAASITSFAFLASSFDAASRTVAGALSTNFLASPSPNVGTI